MCTCRRSKSSRKQRPLCHLQALSYCDPFVRLECLLGWSATPTMQWSPTRSVCTQSPCKTPTLRRKGPLCHLPKRSYCDLILCLECLLRWSATSTMPWSPTRSVSTHRFGNLPGGSRRIGPLCHLEARSYCDLIVPMECLLRWSATPTLPSSRTQSECTHRPDKALMYGQVCTRRTEPMCHLQEPSKCVRIVPVECFLGWSTTPTMPWSPTRSVCTRRQSNLLQKRGRRKGPLCHLQEPSCCDLFVRLEYFLGWSATPTMPWSLTRSVCTHRSSSRTNNLRRKELRAIC